MARYTYGGQALIEGVLMRGRDSIAVALRSPDGGIAWQTERLDSGFHASRWAKAPFLRGLTVLYETLVVGTRWLVRSASLSASDAGVELGKGAIALMLGITLVAGIGIFFILPLLLSMFATGSQDSGSFTQQLAEGLIRVAIFLGYLLLIARAPDVQRVFAYHGAEHMTIHALEAGDPLTVTEIRKYPTAHQRCGTEFLVVVIALSIILFSFVGKQPLPIMIISRILLIPVIAAIGYELLRAGAKYRTNPVVRLIMLPGMWVQKITTRQPTDDMIEVAIVSMEEALVADGESIPAGSAESRREPLAEVRARLLAEFQAAGDGQPSDAEATGSGSVPAGEGPPSIAEVVASAGVLPIHLPSRDGEPHAPRS